MLGGERYVPKIQPRCGEMGTARLVRVERQWPDPYAQIECLQPAQAITIPGADETPSPPVATSYATVAVADSGSTGSTFTISWYDPEGCDGEYSASIWDARSNQIIVTIQTLGPDGWSTGDTGRSGLGLGSTASGNTQMMQTLDYIDLDGDQFAVEVYCPAEGRVFAEVPLPSLAAETVERPKPGTYSSEAALTGLTISSGTLSPAFNKDGFLYAVLDVPNDDEQVTFNATAKSGYSISWDPATDADSSADGQQVDLAVGYNTIFVNVDHDEGVNSFTYEVIVKRAEANTPATGAPAITGTAQQHENHHRGGIPRTESPIRRTTLQAGAHRKGNPRSGKEGGPGHDGLRGRGLHGGELHEEDGSPAKAKS